MDDKLTEIDIPGAILNEPLENATVPALKWWVLCRGFQVPSSWRKPKLIDHIRKLKREGAQVVDVDGSYLYRKLQASASDVDLSIIPEPPLIGWELVESPSSETAKKLPIVTHGLLYTYLADCSGASGRGEAFRSLQRGYVHWSSGRMNKLEINYRHPLFCHVRCQMVPSMKQGLYNVYVLLGRVGDVASIRAAMCECAAGKSASCTHISALLHALASLSPSSNHQVSASLQSDDDETLPITSYLCKWKAPSKRKESNMPVSEAIFHKHVYGRQRKYDRKPLEDFDPRPPDLRGKTEEHLKELLTKVRGQGLGVSLLFDEECRCWSSSDQHLQSPVLPSKTELQQRVEEFKKSLCMPPQKLREIEQSTRNQSQSSLWYSVRQYRLTASNFGAVYHQRPSTTPHSLVLQIIGNKQFSSAATEWGKRQEPVAREEYVKLQHKSGHHGLYTCQSGFMISEQYPYLGASPDGVVHDSSSDNPFGLVEIKCPYSVRDETPKEVAASDGAFCCQLKSHPDGKESLQLKRSHSYFCQVQGQMAIAERTWCDFVVYTEKGMSIERIQFDPNFWNNDLLPKLESFYDNCLAPEIVSPVHVLGMPVRDLQNM